LNQKNDNLANITIGLPVYNGERFLRTKLDSILSQTYENFELIISNNGSTDKTHEICNEYELKDNRIKYFSHKKNNDAFWNYNFILNKASCDYFMWTSVDDVLLPTFIEKNLNILEKNKTCVASISKIETYESENDNKLFNPTDLKHYESVKKIRNKIRPRSVFSITGDFDKKSRLYLKKSSCYVFYSIFKTNIIKKSFFYDPFLGDDWAIFLNVLKYGDLLVTDEILMYQYEHGLSGRGMISVVKLYYHGIDVFFPWARLTNWCIKNLGWKFFLRNMDYFFQLNLEGSIALVDDFIHLLLHKKKL
jgi:glycosyltransferase involved in cell wall biosynthesis|tara:strand:+ start:374 stop:1291 length:918 start_codon:yes stop_codon:yes gene_type:complete